MPLKHFYSSAIRAGARKHRATTREGVMGIGAESHVDRTEKPRKPKSTPVRLATQTILSDHEEDDSEPEVQIISSSVIPKRKLSVTATPGPRSKRTRTARALSDEPKLPLSESEEDSGDDESEYEDEEAVDPESKQKAAQASKDFDSACRSCRINANKALKTKYELQISKLKSEHKQELRKVKVEKAEALTETKGKASTEKATTKAKYEKYIKELKGHRDEKIEAWKDKHKEAVDEWQKRFDEDRKKIKKLTAQRDEAEAKRKENEKSAADKVKAAEDDLKAGERKLKEERKQMLREMQQQIDILKPEHSKSLKDKDRLLEEMTQKTLSLERDVKSGENALDRVQTTHEALVQKYQQLKGEHTNNQKHTKQVEKDLNDTKKYIAGVDGRADVRLVRALEKIDVQETNVREHANRVITLQRENYNLKDTVNQLARLGREKKDEVERLKAELQSTKAELGVVKGMEDMSGGFDSV